MVARDEDFGAALTLAQESDGTWSPSEAVPSREPRDWRPRFEQERARADRERERADAAEARLSKAAVESAKRRKVVSPSGQVSRLQKENARLSREAARLDKRLALESQSSESHKETIRSQNREIIRLVAELRRLRDQKDTVKRLSEEAYRLRFALDVSEAAQGRLKARLLRATEAVRSKSPPRDTAELRAALRRSRRQKTTIRSLSKENARLHRTVRRSETRKEALKGRLAKLRAGKTLSDTVGDLRKALSRSRRQKTTIKSLGQDNARLHRAVRKLETRKAALESQLARLRATGTTLSKALFGRRSEQQEKPRSERKRGQQRGAAGHGRTQRPTIEERTEEHNPSPDERVCACCGKPYVANGAEESTLIEIEVQAHKRVIRRPRWRRGCTCESSPREVSAPPVPRLFDNTPYGISVWARVLFERCAYFRPLNRVAAWLSDQALAISPGTLGDSEKRFVPMFEPVAEAILAHQNKAAVRHGDETGWRIHSLREQGRSSRAWLWTSVSNDAVYFHIDPSRSAEVAKTLFGAVIGIVFLVCDRLSTYKKMARELDGKVVLCWCWVHQRRDFIHCAAGQVRMTQWCQAWIERIASIYRLNEARLIHYDPCRDRQRAAFTAAQSELKATVDDLFSGAERELAALPPEAREGKALRSLVNHREGLSVFVDRPQVPMDNNAAERALRGPVIGRRLSFGSDSETGAQFTALTYSVLGTLALNRIDVLRWLEAWLGACAENGGRPPDDLSPWLPWSMDEERRRVLTASG